MARKSRIHLPGGFYLVTLRGNGGNDVFLSVDDSRYFEDLISEGIERYSYKIHAYCWMKNHIHLLVQITDIPLSKIIQNLSFRYTHYFNKKYKKYGHLFYGRYKAILIDPKSYLLEIVRYLHLYPYEAEIVQKPHEYKWSSHRTYLGRSVCEWLVTDYVLSKFSHNIEEARDLYDIYIRDGLHKSYIKKIQSNKKDSRILGNDQFVTEIFRNHKDGISMKISFDKIIEVGCKYFDIDIEHLKSLSRSRDLSKIRAAIGYLIVEYSDDSLSEYSKFVNRDVSTLSSAVGKYRTLMKNDVSSKNRIKDLKRALDVH